MPYERAYELCRLAEDLARNTAGHPRWMARHRAVSTAYYALFHALAEMCARELIGAWTPYPAFRHVYRSLDHGVAKSVLAKPDPELPTPSEALQQLAIFFVDLQERRHRADYDPSYRIAPSDLMALIANTRSEIEAMTSLAGGERQLLAARLIGRTRVQSRRSR